MKSLTNQQAKIYNFLTERNVDTGFPPTQAEIQRHFGFKSINSVRSHLALIEKKGYIKLNYGKARGIKLNSPPTLCNFHKEDSIPLLGKIAAGTPLLAEQNLEDNLMVSPSLFGGGELFALHIAGESMKGIGINDGDIAIIRQEQTIENGDIAAVLIDNDATLKRVFFRTESLILKSENPAFKDIECRNNQHDTIQILGRYMGIIRANKKRYCL